MNSTFDSSCFVYTSVFQIHQIFQIHIKNYVVFRQHPFFPQHQRPETRISFAFFSSRTNIFLKIWKTAAMFDDCVDVCWTWPRRSVIEGIPNGPATNLLSKENITRFILFNFSLIKDKNSTEREDLKVKTSGKSSRSQQRWARGRSQQQLLKIIHYYTEETIWGNCA